MNGCQFCGGTGRTTIESFCRCSIGVALRIKSNADTARAYARTDTVAPFATRPHADGIDDRAESIQGPIATGVFPDDDLTHPTMAERLRAIGYRAPVTKVHHYCANCGLTLADNQLCGAWCQVCITKAAKAKLEFKREDWRITWASLVGLLVGIACTLLIVWGFK